MQLRGLSIPDVLLITPRMFEDSRGVFFVTYQENVFQEHGMPGHFVQDNISVSSRGVLRGMHYQLPPKAQAKLIRVLRGRIFDVVVDVRRNSKTLGKHVAVTLDAKDRQTLFVPPGFAHGFLALEDQTEVSYKVSDFYSPEDERGIIWNDPALGIAWPKLDTAYILSGKDKEYPAFKAAPLFILE